MAEAYLALARTAGRVKTKTENHSKSLLWWRHWRLGRNQVVDNKATVWKIMPLPLFANQLVGPSAPAYRLSARRTPFDPRPWLPLASVLAVIGCESTPSSDADPCLGRLDSEMTASGAGPAQGGWQADPAIVERATQARPGFNYHEDRVPSYDLPDPLCGSAGSLVRSPEEWAPRRAEILELFREHVYGRMPGRPDQLRFDVLEEDRHALDGAATLKRVAVESRHEGRDHRFDLTLFVPNDRRGPAPAFLLLDIRFEGAAEAMRQVRSGFGPLEDAVARGYAIAAVRNNEITPDDDGRYREGVIRLFEGDDRGPRPPDSWRALAAWAWGASRAMDYFETDPDVDAGRVAIIGHSRGGKAALWAGAEDERFALVISNESGAGGAALSRRHYGETIARITSAFPHWFAENFAAFGGREDSLPVDQHMLLSLQAPRALYVASADADLWADPRGEFLALAYASPVYALWGDPPIQPADMPPLDQPIGVGRRGYHIRSGTHDLTAYDWARYLDFADGLWR